MKRRDLERHLRRHGCVLTRQGRRHEVWENPQTDRRSISLDQDAGALSLTLAISRAMLVALVLVCSCSSQPGSRSTGIRGEAHLESGDIDALMDKFPERAEIIRSLLTGPASERLPPRAVSIYNFLDAEGLDPGSLIWERPAGRFEGDYYLASASPREISVTIICLVSGQQRDCDTQSRTWTADLEPNSYRRFPVSLELEVGDRVEVLRVVGGETERFDPASGALYMFAGRRASPQPTEVRGRTPKVLGGCDVAAFTSTDSVAESVPRSVPRNARTFVTVEFCEEQDWIIRPILVADGREVLDVHGSAGFGVTRVQGRTFVAELPQDIPREVESIQAFVLVDPIRSFHVLVSPALRLE